LLSELADALAPSAAEIAHEWSEQLASRLPAPIQRGPDFVAALVAINLWLFQQFLRRLREGNLVRLFRDSQRYNEDLLRTQSEMDGEFQSSMGQLIDSLEIMAGIVGRRIRHVYGNDARLCTILSAFGRLALRLAHVAASTYHEKRSDALARSLRVTSALLGASRELQTRAASASEIAARLAPIVCRSIACDRTTVFLWNGGERAYTFAAAYGFSHGERVLLAAMRPTRREFPRVDLALRSDHAEMLEGLLPRHLLQRFDVGALAMAPMTATDGRALGVVTALRREPKPFDAADTAIVRGIAQIAARAIENVLLQEELTLSEQRRREAAGTARDAERRRVARELHDSVLQDLTAVKLQLESRVRQQPGAGLETTIESVIGLIASLRRVVDDLRHPDFGSVSLRVAIGAHAEALAHRHGVALTLDLPDDVDVPNWTTRDVYRIAQEAIANAVRHGAPKCLVVRLYNDGDAAVLSVEDDGSGFDRERFAMGSGILGMRERAAALGADLDLISAPGEGTQVRLSLRRIRPAVADADD
jgi:signal transduction histidine kinase